MSGAAPRREAAAPRRGEARRGAGIGPLAAAVRPWAAVLSARFRSALQYRVAALAGIATQGFFGFILISGLEAFYRAVGAGPGMPGAAEAAARAGIPEFSRAASYIWLGQAFLVLTPWTPDPEIRDAVRSGSVAQELLKPFGLQAHWYVRALGLKAAQLSLRSLPILALGGFLLPALGLGDFGLRPPASPAGFLCFLASLGFGLFLCAAVVNLFNAFLFRAVSAVGVTTIMASAVALGSGLIIPLPLIGGSLGRLARLSPFAGLTDLPFRFWLGLASPSELPAVLALQLAWLALLLLGTRRIFRRELVRVDILGG